MAASGCMCEIDGRAAKTAKTHFATTALTPIMPSGFMERVRVGQLIAKPWPIVGGVLLVAAFGWAGWQALQQPREPLYDGHPLSYWLYQVARSNSIPYPKGLSSDSNATPLLIGALAREDTLLGKSYLSLWPRIPPFIQRRLQRPVPAAEVRRCAALMLGRLGVPARAAVPTLVQRMSDGDAGVRRTVVWALGLVGEGDQTVVPALAAALKDNDMEVRFIAVQSLHTLGQKGDRTVVAPLVAAMSDSDPWVRRQAVMFLAQLWQGEKAFVTVLVAALKDKDPTVQDAAVFSLGKLGRNDEAATAALKGALSDAAQDGSGARVGVLYTALHELDPLAAEAIIRAANEAKVRRRQLDSDAAAKAGVKMPPP
jgi:HEAT repeat protein